MRHCLPCLRSCSAIIKWTTSAPLASCVCSQASSTPFLPRCSVVADPARLRGQPGICWIGGGSARRPARRGDAGGALPEFPSYARGCVAHWRRAFERHGGSVGRMDAAIPYRLECPGARRSQVSYELPGAASKNRLLAVSQENQKARFREQTSIDANRRITAWRLINVIILSSAPAPDPRTPPAAPELLPPRRPPPAVSPQPPPMHRCSPSLTHIAVTSPA